MKTNPIKKFDSNFKLETERLLLRPFTSDDLDDFSFICADPEVMRFIGKGMPLNKDTVKQQILSWIDLYREQGFGLLALTLKDNNKLLGFCGLLQQIVDGEAYIELGCRLDRHFWGRGIATEAAESMKDYAFHQLEISELISKIQVENIVSKRVAKNIFDAEHVYIEDCKEDGL